MSNTTPQKPKPKLAPVVLVCENPIFHWSDFIIVAVVASLVGWWLNA